MDHGRAVTLEDVAREAGVAVSTVSRALSRPERVSARTREHVQAVARRLDYRPNLLARGLPSGRTRHAGAAGHRHHQPAPVRADPRGGDAGGGGGLHAGARRQPGPSGAGGRARGPAGRHRWTGSCWRPAGGPTTSSSSCAAAARSRCTTGSSRASRAWSTTRTTAAARSSSTWSRWATARWPTSAARATRGPRTSGGRRSPPTPAARGRRSSRLGPFPPTLEGGVAAADVGLAAGATALVAFNDLMAIGVLRRLEQRGVAVPERDVGGGPRRHLRRRLLPPAAHDRRQPGRGGGTGAGRPPARQPPRRTRAHRAAHRAAGARLDRGGAAVAPVTKIETRRQRIRRLAVMRASR